jgi:hypothetical protein
MITVLQEGDTYPTCDAWTLGLDVSTSAVGYCLLGSNSTATYVASLGAIRFNDCKTLWEKADKVRAFAGNFYRVDEFCIEEALQRFSPGLSSAATISTLIKFNGIVSYSLRDVFKRDPNFLSATSARKLCGIKLQKQKTCGKNHKEQVFEHMCSNDLRDVKWEHKRNSDKVVDWARDATDAYVIARAYNLSK